MKRIRILLSVAIVCICFLFAGTCSYAEEIYAEELPTAAEPLASTETETADKVIDAVNNQTTEADNSQETKEIIDSNNDEDFSEAEETANQLDADTNCENDGTVDTTSSLETGTLPMETPEYGVIFDGKTTVNGREEVFLNELLSSLGYEGNIESAISSNENAIRVFQDENGAWKMISDNPFLDETVTVIVDGVEYVIYAHDPNPVNNEVDLISYATNGGDIYLTDNFAVNSNVSVLKDLVIDLQGRTLSLGNNYITVGNNAKLTINDSVGSNGSIISNGNYAIFINGGSLIINKGNIGTIADNIGAVIRGIFIFSGDATINDGSVYATGSASSTNGANVGIVNDLNGKLTVNGGTINASGTCSSYGIHNFGGLIVNGGTIKGSSSDSYGDGIINEVDGTAAINGNAVISGASIDGIGRGVHNFGSISINGGTITGSSTNRYAAGLRNSQEGLASIGGTAKIFGRSDNGHAVAIVNANELTIYGGTVSATGTNYVAGVENTGNLTLKEGTVSATGVDSAIGVNNTGALTIEEGTVSATGAKSGTGVINTGTLTIEEGSVSATSTNYAAGVENTGNLTLKEGTVSATGADSATGVKNTGALTVNGGTVIGSSTNSYGDGISNVDNGTVIINYNATITGASADGWGRGIHNSNVVTINGGTITGRSINSIADGVSSGDTGSYAICTINGGTISGISTNGKGFGLLNGNLGTASVNGLSYISGTSTNGIAIGVYNCGKLSVSGGKISGNSVTSKGTGIFDLTPLSYASINGGTIIGIGNAKSNPYGSTALSGFNLLVSGGYINGSLAIADGSELSGGYYTTRPTSYIKKGCSVVDYYEIPYLFQIARPSQANYGLSSKPYFVQNTIIFYSGSGHIELHIAYTNNGKQYNNDEINAATVIVDNGKIKINHSYGIMSNGDIFINLLEESLKNLASGSHSVEIRIGGDSYFATIFIP